MAFVSAWSGVSRGGGGRAPQRGNDAVVRVGPTITGRARSRRLQLSASAGEEFKQALAGASELVSAGPDEQARQMLRAAVQTKRKVLPEGVSNGGAVLDRRPSGNAVGFALRHLENHRIKSRETIQRPPDGAYMLVAIANQDKKDRSKVSGVYNPFPTQLAIFGAPDDDGGGRSEDVEAEGVVYNNARLPVIGSIEFSGWFRWLPRKRMMEFNFYNVAVKLFFLPTLHVDLRKKDRRSLSHRQCLREEPRGKTPFFTFFYVDDGNLCARGRSGGLALYALESPKATVLGSNFEAKA